MDFGNLEDFISDRDLELNGIDIQLGRGRTIKIRRAGGANREFESLMAEEILNYNDEHGDTDIPPDLAREAGKRIFAKNIILGWDGIKDRNDKTIPWSQETALELLQKSDDIYDLLDKMSLRQRNFRYKEINESSKK